MQAPLIELIPGRPAVRDDEATILDVLVRITPPLPEIHVLRPPVNLGIVLDRSGSMSEGRKMDHAREATVFAIRQLLPTDRVSITVFDDQVETISASAPVTDKPGLIAQIKKICPRGSTALHAGWASGAQQVLEHVAWQGLNRVLLLSDGLANHGLTDPEAICGEVRGMAGRQVSTSTIGVGDNYNEDLMGAMARAGMGNYYFVENSVQLADIFQTELQGLMATTGRRAELTVRPRPGVELVEVLTELERGPAGQIKLPDLVSDMPDLDPGEDQGLRPAALVRALPLPPGLGSHRRGAPGSSGARSEPGPPGRSDGGMGEAAAGSRRPGTARLGDGDEGSRRVPRGASPQRPGKRAADT